MGNLTKRHSGALSKYDPESGLKTVAAAEAAERHFARAKDATKLQQAIRAKLEAQAEFVLWWDTQVEKQQGARGVGKKVASQVEDATIAGRGGLPSRQTIDRWRRKLNDPDKFETAYEAACARYAKILEFEGAGPAQSHNSGENEWYTPAEFVEAAREALGDIDLDPASSDAANEVVKAGQIFTADDDGLAQQWDGAVWMNPPYAQPLIGQFCEKLVDSVRAGNVPSAIVLVNNATETQWFRSLADIASAVCFPTGRVRFWSQSKASAAPLQGQALIYIGDDPSAFMRAFESFGWVMVSPKAVTVHAAA